jgi:hypothetical protein
VKLPPVALTAPTLCPRCDAPALYEDRCTSCGLQLGVCGACRGVVGPFDRYCGFCGHDLSAGEARSPVWRFWLLVAMIPMIAVLVVGATFFGGPVAKRVGDAVFPPSASPSPSPGAATKLYRSPNLHLVYAVPADWPSPADYSLSTTTPLQQVVAARMEADIATYGSTKGSPLAAKPGGALIALGPLGQAPPGADANDPSSVLGADVASLTLSPPTGLKIAVAQPAQSITVDGRTGKSAVFKVTLSDGSVYFFERAYLVSPAGLFRVDAMVPQADWVSGDRVLVDAVIQSVRLTG